MALAKPASISFLKKRKSQTLSSPMPSAASYLSALSQADARARNHNNAGRSPTSTPALSLSSSITSSSEDTVLNEDDTIFDNSDGLALPARPPTSEQVFTTVHTEFGHCADQRYRLVSEHPSGTELPSHVDYDPPYYILLSTYVSYLILICLGHVRDFVGKRLNPSSYTHLIPKNGYAPLNSDFDSFYTRRLKTRLDECFSQPVTGVAGRTIVLLDRISPDYNHTQIFTGNRTRALNISSYNYLGFAQARGGCADAVEDSIRRYGISTCGTRLTGGSSDLHTISEALVANFVGMEDALISSMGFATNSTFIPALVGKGCLVISDELNHASIRFGVRLSGAHVRMFKHNDMKSLESLLREVISQGQPKHHRPWKKILVIVEGLYSMEGTLVNLPAVIELKKKYKFYLFVDEAHSIGALGPHGRGVADYFGINPRNIDMLMGTFTKSFGAAGGYIAGNKDLIDRLRVHGHSGAYAEAMTPAVLTQVVASMASIMGVAVPSMNPSSSTSTLRLTSATNSAPNNTACAIEEEYSHPGAAPPSSLPQWLTLPPALSSGIEGSNRLRRLAFNARYLHNGLNKLGFITYGHPASPIVPLLLFNPGKMNMFHRMMKDRQTPIVVVVVAYPATPLVTSRVRFCVSAAHTKEDVDTVLRACDEIGDVLDLKHGIKPSERWSVEQICERAVEVAEM
ncbi:serine palmitoyltransferase 2 [Macrolepiota fuliginosa MF-IS2]|uniref:serine C-palmitoyltransferase n=1 Tax=Macrolepiota fuliginosa MF-IS2 TaxID=1400762 RepID=A0A9P5XM29_9AGAR|nr:serine palmitoyltransferase 2 [Macrolepiota fuliginosa MF-IS2]